MEKEVWLEKRAERLEPCGYRPEREGYRPEKDGGRLERNRDIYTALGNLYVSARILFAAWNSFLMFLFC
ncbi:hypothetical protein AS29_010425 [Bacillus sp. SJS]|nr:hypothetical protein AS29_010425 [Bacillus sp. SJS]